MNSTSENSHYPTQYLFVMFGSFSFISSCGGIFIISRSYNLHEKHPFFLVLCIADGTISLAYVLCGSARFYQLDNGTFNELVSPISCLKFPCVHLYFIGAELSSIFGCLMSLERLTAVFFPYWFRTRWNSHFSLKLIYAACGYVAATVLLSYVATVRFSETGALIKSWCPLTSVAGPIYSVYFCAFCVLITTSALILSVVSFIMGRFHISELQKKNKTILLVQRRLVAQMRQLTTVLALNLVMYLLTITTNINFLNLVMGWPTLNPDTSGGWIAVSAYCLSCGLTIFVLIAYNNAVRNEVKRYLPKSLFDQNNVVSMISLYHRTETPHS